ncbi:hypothetical protein C8Q80DRAFT_360708 [Daedaleopsis nitida]|nr:hypothetical protein C8Q80DRAFT_360708 [Daedaleopsis nitida]
MHLQVWWYAYVASTAAAGADGAPTFLVGMLFMHQFSDRGSGGAVVVAGKQVAAYYAPMLRRTISECQGFSQIFEAQYRFIDYLSHDIEASMICGRLAAQVLASHSRQPETRTFTEWRRPCE